jgi:hypothetical protein
LLLIPWLVILGFTAFVFRSWRGRGKKVWDQFKQLLAAHVHEPIGRFAVVQPQAVLPREVSNRDDEGEMRLI